MSDAAANAIRMLLAANLRPEFGFNREAAVHVWTTTLEKFDQLAIVRAAAVWIESASKDFPTLAEFTTVVESQQRAIDRPPPPERGPDEDCSECGEEGGWVFSTNPSEGGIADRRPCSICRAAQCEMWRAGHFNARPGQASCHCNHPQCSATKWREKRGA